MRIPVWNIILILYTGAELGILIFANDLKDIAITVKDRPDDCSVKATWGNDVAIRYSVRLHDGEVFDTNMRDGAEPLRFKLGSERIIPGIQQAVLEMCMGEKRQVTIPPHLAYGEEGSPPYVPGNATLVFDLDLVSIDVPSMLFTHIYNSLYLAAIPVVVSLLIYVLYIRFKNESSMKQKPSRPQKRNPSKTVKKKKH